MSCENYLEEMNTYKLSRDTVQLIAVDTLSMSVRKIKPIAGKGKRLNLSINKEVIRAKEETDTIKGTIGVQIYVMDEHDERCAVINVFQMGIFRAGKKLEMNEFYHRVDVQLVPQLISYVRSAVSILAAESGLAPIVLPTMDVLKSMRENAKQKQDSKEA